MNIQKYVSSKYSGSPEWFVEECDSVYNQNLVEEYLSIRKYLDGQHKICNSQVVTWNGKTYENTVTVLQYAKLIIQIQCSYLLKNGICLISENENTLNEFKNVYKKGKYNTTNWQILNDLCRFGNAYEYIFKIGDVIKSKVINVEDCFEVLDPETNEVLCTIEHWEDLDGVGYWNIYYPDSVECWTNTGGYLHCSNNYRNSSGLPIHYKNNLNELDGSRGKSQIFDIVGIIDNMELLLSRGQDSLERYIDPIFLLSGQPINLGKDGSGAFDKNVGGKGIVTDETGTAKFISGNVAIEDMKNLYNILVQTLMNIGMTSSVMLNNAEIANISEVSIKLLFNLQNIKSSMDIMFMQEGVEKRNQMITEMLKDMGKDVDDSITVQFSPAIPQLESEIVDNLEKLRGMGGISKLTMIERNPYVNNVLLEVKRLEEEGVKEVVDKTEE